MGYLTRWRMALAANLLRTSSMSLCRVGAEVGYQTDTAFSRAFRREFGVPPATWRRKQLQAPQAPTAAPAARPVAVAGTPAIRNAGPGSA